MVIDCCTKRLVVYATYFLKWHICCNRNAFESLAISIRHVNMGHCVTTLDVFTMQDMMQWKEGLAVADGQKTFGMTLCAGVCIARKV